MARKKSAAQPKENALDRQVMDGDTITIADVKQFIEDAKKKREPWLNIADRSWAEIKKRNKKGSLYGGNDLIRARRFTRFPLWWSCLMIRQPITFARLPIPVLKDTQGDDPYGRTACIVGERFTRSILKTFDPFSEFAACNDDFLVTNFAFGRVFYRMVESSEPEQIRLQELQPPPQQPGQQPLPPMVIDPRTNTPVQNYETDDLGPYILTGNQITVDNEEVYFDAGLYCNLYIDPEVRQWSKVTRIAFEYQYTYREFIEKFGKDAFAKISKTDIEDYKDGKKPIITFEYHDKFLKEVRWFAEDSEDFFQPASMTNIEDLQEVNPDGDVPKETDNSDLFGLTGFFPCVEPLRINTSTDEYWPTPEYFQVQDIIEDIHTIVSRLVTLTKAIRIRFLFDSNIVELRQLISELGEASALGVPNLQQALMNGKGDLSSLVAYFPVDQMIEGVKNMYEAFQQRLDMFFNITGISDIIRGQTPNDGTQKTYGEKQLESKFALNRIEPYQRKMQEWVKNNYQLLMELGLKMFNPQTVDDYVTPQTLEPEHQERYEVSLELLKSNKRRRFRVDFETDSTVAINEQWKRQQATDLANTLTKAMEATANIANTQPELAGTELKVLKHLIGEFSDGKLFIDDITKSIEEVIDKVSQPKPPEFDKERAANELAQEKLHVESQRDQFDLTTKARFQNLQLQTNTQIELAKLNQKAQNDSTTQQIKQIQLQIDRGVDSETLRQSVTKLQADIAQGWEDLNIKKATLLQVAQTEGGKAELAQFQAIIDQRVKGQEISLSEAALEVDKFRVQMEAADAHVGLQERVASEERLQSQEARLEVEHQMDAQAHVAEMLQPPEVKAPPVSIDASKTLQIKLPNPPAKSTKGKK